MEYDYDETSNLFLKYNVGVIKTVLKSYNFILESQIVSNSQRLFCPNLNLILLAGEMLLTKIQVPYIHVPKFTQYHANNLKST